MMRKVLNDISMDGVVVIGEGEKDEVGRLGGWGGGGEQQLGNQEGKRADWCLSHSTVHARQLRGVGGGGAHQEARPTRTPGRRLTHPAVGDAAAGAHAVLRRADWRWQVRGSACV